MVKNTVLALLILISYTNFLKADGFLKTSGIKVVNSSGQEVYLRGINLGNWFIQEGYMMKTSSFANAEFQLKAKIEALIGAENTKEFYNAWFDNFITKKDIDQIAEWGFNSIRLPLHYNKLTTAKGVYVEEHFVRIDSVLSWCEQNKIYLFLDLHAAPGSQNGEGISDAAGEAKLWTDESYQEWTVELWGKLAQRYADKEWIGGYDLINETKYSFPFGNIPLWELMKAITEEIRKYDSKHMVIIEGNWYATDFNNLPPQLWDSNLMLSFHKYWNATDVGTINYLLNLRSKYNVPLWLGESGENSNGWFTEVIQLMENNDIGYAFWPYKKLESISGLATIKVPADYQKLLNYWSSGGTKPTVDFAKNALLNLVQSLKFENCMLNHGMVDAMFRQLNSTALKPFTEITIPGVVFGTYYDMGRAGSAYSDKIYKNTNNSDAYNSGWSFRNDGVDIEKCSDVITNGYNIGWIETGEWVKFTINVQESGTYNTAYRVAGSTAGGKIIMRIDDQPAGSITTIPSTGGWTSWSDVNGPAGINLTAGTHVMQLQFLTGGFNFNYVEFSKGITDVSENDSKPYTFGLNQNYPNPFNPETNIKFQIANSGMVTLKVYNLLGKEVKTLLAEERDAGEYKVNFEASELSSGVYYYQLRSNGQVITRKMTLIK